MNSDLIESSFARLKIKMLGINDSNTWLCFFVKPRQICITCKLGFRTEYTIYKGIKSNNKQSSVSASKKEFNPSKMTNNKLKIDIMLEERVRRKMNESQRGLNLFIILVSNVIYTNHFFTKWAWHSK